MVVLLVDYENRQPTLNKYPIELQLPNGRVGLAENPSRHQRLINLIHYRLVLRAKLLVEATQPAMAVKGREV